MKETLEPRTIQEKERYMIKMYNLTSDQMYVSNDILLIRRSGCDRIEADHGVVAEVTHLSVVPYKDEVCVVMGMRGRVPGDSVTHQTVVTVSPDTTLPDHKHYAEIAEYRCRLRILFKALQISQYGIMPSDGFIQKDEHKAEDIVNNLKDKFEKRNEKSKKVNKRAGSK